MVSSATLIPARRLRRLPRHLRLAHEFCFFLHDEATRMLVEYEGADADSVEIKFKSKKDGAKFFEATKQHDSSLDARRAGYCEGSTASCRNPTTMALVSDCMHHLYEALFASKSDKVVVACNLLRSPPLDSLTYLAWMFA